MNNSLQSLRVAIIASSLRLAGAEKQTFYMARALHQAGVEVRLYQLCGEGHYEPVLQQCGVPVERIYHANRPWLMLAKLTASLFRWRPQIVLAAQFGDLRFAVPAGRICNALILGGVRSDGFYELNEHGRWSRWMLRLSHGLIANSFRARKNLMSQKISPKKIEVVPNVIDLADFDECCKRPLEARLPADRIIAVAVGNLHACKRFDRFIEALAVARRSEPALAGVIAGADCGARADLQARAQALGLTPEDLIFLGRFDRVPALLARSTMLVLSSDYEGFPNVILEAMSARLPVISVPAGDAGSIVQHGNTGYLVDADDVRGMGALMVQMARFSELRKQFGEVGRKCVEQKYNCEPLAERLLDAFHCFAERQRRFSLRDLLARGLQAKNAAVPSNSMFFARHRQLESTGLPVGKSFTPHS
jgi:glycosyltransferase involved in cell wall biosynthesis